MANVLKEASVNHFRKEYKDKNANQYGFNPIVRHVAGGPYQIVQPGLCGIVLTEEQAKRLVNELYIAIKSPSPVSETVTQELLPF